MENEVEIWGDIPGWEGYYQASTLGRIRTVTRKIENPLPGTIRTHKMIYSKILKPRRNRKGYHYQVFNPNGIIHWITVHRLVATTFMPNIENKPQLNHLNGVKSDNRLVNLEWCTNSENQIHAIKIGLRKNTCPGESNANSTLLDKDVAIIYFAREFLGLSFDKIAPLFNVNKSTVERICKHKTWNHLTNKIDELWKQNSSRQ